MTGREVEKYLDKVGWKYLNYNKEWMVEPKYLKLNYSVMANVKSGKVIIGGVEFQGNLDIFKVVFECSRGSQKKICVR